MILGTIASMLFFHYPERSHAETREQGWTQIIIDTMLMRKKKKIIEEGESHRDVFKHLYEMRGYFSTTKCLVLLIHFIRSMGQHLANVAI